MKGPVLLIQDCRISMPKGSIRMTQRHPSEDTITLMESQKTEISVQTDNS